VTYNANQLQDPRTQEANALVTGTDGMYYIRGVLESTSYENGNQAFYHRIFQVDPDTLANLTLDNIDLSNIFSLQDINITFGAS
jgi:hypothetical protein